MCQFNPKNDCRRIDPCMKNLIEWLNGSGYKTVASCCGHGKYPMTIVIDMNGIIYQEVLSSAIFTRPKTKFYKKDKQGVYYIPEVITFYNLEGGK